MSILLIILGAVGWVLNINGLLIVPPVLYYGLIIAGVVWILIVTVIDMHVSSKISNKIRW